MIPTTTPPKIHKSTIKGNPARSAFSGNAVQPFLRAELLLYELPGLRELVCGHVIGCRTVEAGEGRLHPLDDLGPAQPGLAAQGIDALVGALGALVAHLLAADPQHLDHLVAVHVV